MPLHEIQRFLQWTGSIVTVPPPTSRRTLRRSSYESLKDLLLFTSSPSTATSHPGLNLLIGDSTLMPIYVFRAATTHSLIEKSYPMGQCPQSLLLDGELYHRVYTPPCISSPTPSDSDSLKLQEEVSSRAQELGMRELVPMRHQSPQQQLKDLKENESRFKDSMQQSLEQSKSRLSHSQKPASRPTGRQISSFLEKQQEKEFNQRKIRL